MRLLGAQSGVEETPGGGALAGAPAPPVAFGGGAAGGADAGGCAGGVEFSGGGAGGVTGVCAPG
jgi:hypothetical protein